MKQKLLLSELDMKQLRNKVQRLQNELIRVSLGLGGSGHGSRGKEAGGEGVWRSVREQKGEGPRVGGRATQGLAEEPSRAEDPLGQE